MSNSRIVLTDDGLERALTAHGGTDFVAELADEISLSVHAMPQRRRFGPWLLGGYRFATGLPRAAFLVLIATLLLAVAGAAISFVGSTQRPPRLPAANGMIVFGSDRAGLTLLDPATSRARSLVPSWEASASGRTDRNDLLAISPGGDRLAYVVNGTAAWSVVIVDLESGAEVDRISGTHSGIWPEWGIQWSGDGSRLVLEATLNGLANVAGADVRSGSLYPIGPTDAQSYDPTASGADDRVAFVATADPFSDDYQLVIAAGDGTSRTGLTVTLPDGALVEGAPDWSPDGAWLVFTIGSGDGRFALARVGDRGGEAVVISPWTDGWVAGQWSPDGTKLLAMTSPQGGRSTDVYTNGDQTTEIHVLNPDGSGWRRIVERGCANGFWAPDGESILFERGACEQPREEAQLVVIDADGANERIVWSGDARVTGRLSIGWQSMPAGR